MKRFATSPSTTAIFVPDRDPSLKEHLILDSVGEVFASLCAKAPIFSPEANAGKKACLVASSP